MGPPLINANKRSNDGKVNVGPIPSGVWELNFSHWRAGGTSTAGKFTHENDALRVPEYSGNVIQGETSDFGSGGWALSPVSLLRGTRGRSGFVFHEDANANGTAEYIGVKYRKILDCYPRVRKFAQIDKIYVLVENYDEGRMSPSWPPSHVEAKDEF